MTDQSETTNVTINKKVVHLPACSLIVTHCISLIILFVVIFFVSYLFHHIRGIVSDEVLGCINGTQNICDFDL